MKVHYKDVDTEKMRTICGKPLERTQYVSSAPETITCGVCARILRKRLGR